MKVYLQKQYTRRRNILGQRRYRWRVKFKSKKKEKKRNGR